jgi:hypothetical protein
MKLVSLCALLCSGCALFHEPEPFVYPVSADMLESCENYPAVPRNDVGDTNIRDLVNWNVDVIAIGQKCAVKNEKWIQRYYNETGEIKK